MHRRGAGHIAGGIHIGGMGGHMRGGFEGTHPGGNRIDSFHLGTNHLDTSDLAMRCSPDRHFGGERFDCDANLYDDDLGCPDLNQLHIYRRWRPGCS
jgi:hypothetical protein